MKRYYAYRLLANNRRVRLKPGGKAVFGPVALAYLRRRAKAQHYRMIVAEVTSKRQQMKAWMRWALSHEPSWHYAQIRPMPLKRAKAHALPTTTDCSGTHTCIAYVAGAPDPNGRHYNGTGYTGTIRATLRRRTSPGACLVGDPIVYGPGNGAHVATVYERGPDPLMFSHGQESGPRLYRHSVEAQAHGGTFSCHDAGVE